MAAIPLALQLYTVRQLLAEDYPGTLARAKEIGYDMVQLTGTLPYDAPEMKRVLDDVGVAPAGMHVSFIYLLQDLQHWIDYCKTVGTRDLVVPYVRKRRRKTFDQWKDTVRRIDEMGAACKEQGIRLSYHNHSFEFVKFEGKYAYDYLFDDTPADHVYSELDTYWAEFGGVDPIEYIRKLKGRLPILHIKDIGDDKERSFKEIGNGTLDWRAIHEAAKEAGVEIYCVEQDSCPGDPIDSIRQSYEFVTKHMAD